ncbi:flocculation protein FLO11 [Leguminivora glycinivorella]|uniref:flocculation protein FLO11 n=1 Tax=Leguminivora glycinivorella TaxID=1035111 RepID=UPI00201088CF|nr:flocculation protein FLO11 [Leguminivora glycinivorella]
MLWISVTLLALFASAQGRAVNISNTWVLPEEGFPVFYRYFRDRISWYEADAVCQFHHANLVTVDTTAQYDAVRAYLKELDISSAVWVGLIRSNPDGDFTWTDYRGLSGEGYWSSAPDSRSAPLCAAADPAADYRWEARACGGPTVASFICELPVPQWALGKDGCMVRALPALTALYLPESAAVQLTADCGLAGVKRVQCTGNVKREELLKELSCNDEDELSSTPSLVSTSTMWPATDTTFTDQEVTTETLTTFESIVTEEKEISTSPPHITETLPPSTSAKPEISASTKLNLNIQNYVRIPLDREFNLEPIHSNDIPQPDHQETVNGKDHLKNLEKNKSYQHHLLHDEMTRLGNSETIFTQPTDHFVPPLVMAKSRISDDMTVLSLEEKHAQQIAEQQRLYSHSKIVEHISVTPFTDTTPNAISSTLTPTNIVKEQISTDTPALLGNMKKETKSNVPKKYSEKHDSVKAKTYKLQKVVKLDSLSTLRPLSSEKEIEISKLQQNLNSSSEEDPSIDLTVIINEPGAGNGQKIFYSNHTNTLKGTEQVASLTNDSTQQPEKKSSITEMPIITTNPIKDNEPQESSTVTLNHEIIKITIINDSTSTENSSPIVFEVTTLVPQLNNITADVLPSSTISDSIRTTSPAVSNDSVTSPTVQSTSSSINTTQSSVENNSDKQSTSGLATTIHMITNKDKIVSMTESPVSTPEIITETATLRTTTLVVNVNTTEKVNATAATTTKVDDSTPAQIEIFNHTDNFEEDHENEEIDDYQSPLLSAANEPLHRPRSRRPQTPANRLKKFNPFRILG